MLYPLNLFTPDPASGGIRPFIGFIIREQKLNIMKVKSWKDVQHVSVPKGGFALPFPNGGLTDTVTNEYSTANAMFEAARSMVPGANNETLNGLVNQAGYVIDPLLTQTYKGTTPRTFEGEWQIIPQSMAESAAVATILYQIKKAAAPDKIKGADKLGMLTAPYTYKITFGNPVIQAAMNFNEMVLTNYNINYFAQGYASTYSDMMPKHISLQMSFAEFGIKYRKDWKEFNL